MTVETADDLGVLARNLESKETQLLETIWLSVRRSAESCIVKPSWPVWDFVSRHLSIENINNPDPDPDPDPVPVPVPDTDPTPMRFSRYSLEFVGWARVVKPTN